MSRLAGNTTGWEMNDVAEIGTISQANGSFTVVSATPPPRNGTYCAKAALTNEVGTAYCTINLGANQTDVWWRFGAYFHVGAKAQAIAIWLASDNAAGAQDSMTWNPVDGLLRFYRGNVGTLLGTSSVALTADAWHLIEIHLTVSTTVGVVTVYQDGNAVISLTNQNTQQTANANVLTYALGFVSSAGSAAVTSYIGLDDLGVNNTAGAINNGQIKDGKVLLQLPAGAGDTTQFTRGGTDSGANWSNVNHVPPNGTTQMVFDGTLNDRDLYTIVALPGNPVSINCVEVIANAANSDSGAGSLALTVESAETINQGASQALSTSFLYYRQLYETDPNTSAAWGSAGVNALEIGQTVA